MDAVVFTAGSGGHTGPEKTIDVDQNAAVRLIMDCKKHGVGRFIMVSAIGADPNSESPKNSALPAGERSGRWSSEGIGTRLCYSCSRHILEELGTGRIEAAGV